MGEGDVPDDARNNANWDTVILRIALTKGLDSNERLVLTGLALDGDWRTGEHCSPTLEWLTEHSGLSRATVARTVVQLLENGWIVRKKRRRRQPSIYTIHLSRLGTRSGAKVSGFQKSHHETSGVANPDIEKSHHETSGIDKSHHETSDVQESHTETSDHLYKSHCETPFPSTTYVPYKVRSPYPDDPPYQEPALRAAPPDAENTNDEKPEAKANPDPPSDFAAIRARLQHQPAPALSHRQRVRRAATHA